MFLLKRTILYLSPGDPRHGITGAISLEGPKPHDLELTKQLDQFLKDNDVFETPEEEEKR
jgi:poly(A) polymerase Pap1